MRSIIGATVASAWIATRRDPLALASCMMAATATPRMAFRLPPLVELYRLCPLGVPPGFLPGPRRGDVLWWQTQRPGICLIVGPHPGETGPRFSGYGFVERSTLVKLPAATGTVGRKVFTGN
jgi:hypothetical protein